MSRKGKAAVITVILALVVVVLVIILLNTGREDFQDNVSELVQDVRCEIEQGICVEECPEGAEITSITGNELCRTGGVCCERDAAEPDAEEDEPDED